MRRLARATIALALCLFANTQVFAQGVWTQVTAPNPYGACGCLMLLSDGSVIVCGSALQNLFSATLTTDWRKLSPDSAGNYVNGTWKTIAPMNVARRDFASNVLPSGKVFVMGGEYASDQSFSNSGEIYDPVLNTWSPVATFPQANFGDDPSVVLSTGKILCGYIGDGGFGGPTDGYTYLYDPVANKWSQTGTKLLNDQCDEEGWTLLPDGSVLSYNNFASPAAGAGSAQRYIPATGTWVATGPVPVPLSGPSLGYEVGPSLLLPDGRVFLIGANNNTVLYHPSTNSWTQGPSLPLNYGCDDASAAMLPNGNVLFVADVHETLVALPSAPSRLFLFNPTANTISDVTPTTGALAAIFAQSIAQQFIMLVLPNGHILMATGGAALWDYTPTGSPNSAWAPTIASVKLSSGTTYTLTGTQLNGISEGTAFGDDLENSTNYPIVRLQTAAGKFQYARTTNWSPGIVASGARQLTTQFTLPTGTPNGTYQLSVIANGIASTSQPFVVGPPGVPSNVTAIFNSSTKTLTLTGDANANSLTINYKAGVLTVEGANGTKINNSTTAFSTPLTGQLVLNAALNDGDDSISFIGINSSTTTITLGNGNDTAAFSLCGIVTLNIDGGAGVDTLITSTSSIEKTNSTNIP